MGNGESTELNLGDKFSFEIRREALVVEIGIEVIKLGRDCFFMVSGQGVCKDDQPRDMPVGAFLMYLNLMGARKVVDNG